MIYKSETDKIRNKVLTFLKDKIDLETAIVLDIGCGSDKLIQQAIGIDKLKNDGIIVNLSIDANEVLPFNKDTVDVIYSSHLLEHLKNPESVLSDWIRVLKSSGWLVLYLPHKDFYTQSNPEHLHNFIQDDIENILVKTNLVKIEIKEMDIDDNKYSFLIIARKVAEGI